MFRNSMHWIWISILTLGLAGACGDDGTDSADAGTMPGEDGGASPDAAEGTPDGGTPVDAAGDIDAPDGIDGGAVAGHPIVVEIYYNDPNGGQNGDNGKEWVKLFNPTSEDIDLAGYALGWGGSDYTTGTLQLTGTITARGCFVIGGPDSIATNGNPTYGQSADLSPDLQNGGDQADGIALFDVTVEQVAADTVPVDVILYGADNNSGGLIDETGVAGNVDHVGTDPGQSLRLLEEGGIWEENLTPTPDTCPPFPSIGI